MKNKFLKPISLIGLISLLVVACTAEPQVIEREVVVTQVVEVETEVEVVVTEVVEVEVEKEVEVEVEVEVTRIVEVEVAQAGTASSTYPTLYADIAAYQSATGNAIASFGEAPMLAEKVTAGELPAVEERLPAEPMVVEPLNGIGVYGGELAGPSTSPTCCGWDVLQMRLQKLFTIDTDLQTIIPNVAKGIDISDDQTTFTIYLREGHKWSDGTPFTAEDFRFYFEDVIQNEELTALAPGHLLAGDNELALFEVIDETTVRFTFAEPKPTFILALAEEVFNRSYRPAHYFKEFHIAYNPDADALAEENGFENWITHFNAKMQPYTWTWDMGSDLDPMAPTLNTFIYVSEDSFGNKVYERNPYFFKVDTAGNQLPYTDSLRRILVEDLQVQDLKAIAGEYSHFGWGTLNNVATYRENEEVGNYRTILTQYNRGNEYNLAFNLNHPDPEMREIFNDIRFRQAMSVAINRDEINELVYFGLATPSQAAPTPDSAFYEPWMTSYFAEFDPEAANALLDEMGLDQRDSDGFRLMPSGEVLFLNFQVSVPEEAWAQIAELVTSYWNDVGVKTNLKQIEGGLYTEIRNAAEHDVAGWAYDVLDFGEFASNLSNTRPGFGSRAAAEQWESWLLTGGEAGEEPPQEVIDLWELGDDFLGQPYGSDEYLRLGSEYYTTVYTNLYEIGTIQSPPQPLLFKNDLCNTPPSENETKWSWTYRQWVMFAPEQWYFSPDGACS
ncbi:MAG: ABC transporter substrate-binding protein [Chloroflexota bacterium]